MIEETEAEQVAKKHVESLNHLNEKEIHERKMKIVENLKDLSYDRQ